MCCYSRLGRRNQALSEYQQCQAVLKRELGIEPMRETTELYEHIAHQDPV
jgi:DNA-binding SARP family transcriptional activator